MIHQPVPTCGVTKPVEHMLTKCLQYRDLREKQPLPSNLFEIIEPNPNAILKLHSFLESAIFGKQI